MPKSKALTLMGSELSPSSRSIPSRGVSTGGSGVMNLLSFGGWVYDCSSSRFVVVSAVDAADDNYISLVRAMTNCLIESSLERLRADC